MGFNSQQTTDLAAVFQALDAKTAQNMAKLVGLGSDNVAATITMAELAKAQSMPLLGIGYGECSTAVTTTAKEVSIANFTLKTFALVAVRFTKAVKAANNDSPTLNVNSTGAKAIFLNGVNIQQGLIRPNTTVLMQYDGTRYNILSMAGLEQTDSDGNLYVDMGLPSGVKWAKRNIDISQPNGFTASEFQYECSFVSWGNTEMHNPATQTTFDYDFGSSNEGPYASTPGALLTGNIPQSQDVARAVLGSPWRMPTKDEFVELFNNIDYVQADGTTVIPSTTTNKLVTVNGVVGIYLKSKINGKLLFFPCAGNGYGTSRNSRGASGVYWASTLSSATYGYRLYFYSGGVNPQYDGSRFFGFSVRPVQ